MVAEKEIIDFYSGEYNEDGRLTRGENRLEFLRTCDILDRFLPEKGLTVIDVGGGTGPYAFWLAGMGHQVHLLDLVPAHVETVKRRYETSPLREPRQKGGGLPRPSLQVSAAVGDARHLPFPDGCADVVLLLGPLYHLQEREDRLQALREACRVVRPGGRIAAAGISRFASLLDGFRSETLDDPSYQALVEGDLLDGKHQHHPGGEYFTTAFFHHPAELREEVGVAGLELEKLVGVEGPIGLMEPLARWMADDHPYLRHILSYLRRIEEEETLLGASFHLLALARRPPSARKPL